MAKKRVSIKDIAELVGVSHPTVSRALRGQGRMSDETRARILAVAQEVGYTPSLMARGLVTQRSYCVGLVVPTFSDPFHSMVAQGIEVTARANEYSLFIAGTDIDPEHEWSVARSFISRQVDGIIVSSSWVGDGYASLTRETDIPVVLVNPLEECQEISAVCHDDYGGSQRLVRHLIQQGHKRIAYLGNRQTGRSNRDRKRAWQEELARANLPDQVSISVDASGIQGGIQGTPQLLQKAQSKWGTHPDAIVCYNDMMALGTLHVLRESGLQVPQDISITGFDDIGMAAVTDPPLTTLRQPRHEMGVRAMQLLLTLIDAGESSSPTHRGEATPQILTVLGELIVRQSA